MFKLDQATLGVNQNGDHGAARDEAVIQIYGARCKGWKGLFSLHCWIVVKRAGSERFERYEVIGYGVRRGAPAIRLNHKSEVVDWDESHAHLLLERRGGADVERLIDRIEQVIPHYPYNDVYCIWPGPNCNTFIAWLGRQVPELALALPAIARGRHFVDLPGFGEPISQKRYLTVTLCAALGLTARRVERLRTMFGRADGQSVEIVW
jgi:hypothetical protein